MRLNSKQSKDKKNKLRKLVKLAGERQDKPRQKPVMLTDDGQNVWNLFAKQDTYSSAHELYYRGIRQIIVKTSRGTRLAIPASNSTVT